MKKKIAAGMLLALGVLGTLGILRLTAPQTCCTQSTLTDIPDDRFAQRALAADADTGRAAELPPRRIVCLTFDDGPSSTTPEILQELAAEMVPATFFVMAADNNRDYFPLVAREAQEGHQIALHSCSHAYGKIYADTTAYWTDLKELRRQLSAYIDVSTIYWLRFPGGSTNTVSCRYGGSGIMNRLKEEAEGKGYHYIDWNVCAQDAAGGHPDADRIFENVVRDAQNQDTCVVLMHDTAATQSTARALPRIIQWFKEKNYEFCTVEQMYEEING